MPWFQKDSLDTIGFRTFRTFRGGGAGFSKENRGFWWYLCFFLTSRNGENYLSYFSPFLGVRKNPNIVHHKHPSLKACNKSLPMSSRPVPISSYCRTYCRTFEIEFFWILAHSIVLMLFLIFPPWSISCTHLTNWVVRGKHFDKKRSVCEYADTLLDWEDLLGELRTEWGWEGEVVGVSSPNERKAH